MPAPIGNQYAVGNTGGRPSKYDDKYCQDIIDFFQKPPNCVNWKEEYYKDGSLKCKTPIITASEFPTFQKFANSIGVGTSTLHDWMRDNEEFAEAYARAKEMQEHIWLVNGMQNLYNAQFAQFFGKNCLGYKDKVEVEANVDTTITVTLEGDLDRLAR